MGKLRTIQEVVRLSGLSRDDLQELVGWLIAEGDLNIFDCFAESDLSCCLKRMNRLCDNVEKLLGKRPESSAQKTAKHEAAADVRPDAKEESTTGEVKPRSMESDVADRFVSPTRKPRLSKNGKPLGRPPKYPKPFADMPSDAPAVAEEPTPEDGFAAEEPEFPVEEADFSAGETEGYAEENQFSPEEAGFPVETGIKDEPAEAPRRRGRKAQYDLDELLTLYPERKPPVVERFEVSDFFIREKCFPELAELRMGIAYKHQIIYRHGERYIVSNYIMRELTPVCVCLMYPQKLQGYRGVGVSIYDDNSGVPIEQAVAHAQTLPEVDGEKWQLLSQLQNAQIREASADLNGIFRKLGGDAFTGIYAARFMDGALPKNNGKIRYVVNLK